MSSTHRVAQGECLSSISSKYGFADYKTIYNHADNAEFKKKRPNPNVIYPGDVLVIPDKDEKTLDAPTGDMSRFKVKVPATKLRIVLKDHEGTAYGGKKYKITVDGKTVEGTTGDDGLVEQPIPPEATSGELVLFLSDEEGVEGHVFPLGLGALDPPEAITGAQARLLNLGYDCEGISGTLDDATKEALRAFQSKNALTVNGTLDQPTIDKLRKVHEE